ncbi:MAG: hypothetical protein IKP86_03070 [Anaerolineaceae bacterium]|nr:hypothetical protein [Anaerolineaceae bacterium]
MENTVYVTMDMDWACDGVLADTIALVSELGIPVCIFATHDTPMLAELRRDPLFTLGIHPNFLPQLNGQAGKGYRETIREMLELVPGAEVIRCHALVDATPILAAAKELGFKADMNLFIPFSSGIALQPFTHFTGLKRLPFFYEDDAWASEPGAASPEEHLLSGALRIFNFHPIHLYLNTETMERYNRAKPYYKEFDKLAPFINRGEEQGARDFLLTLKRTADENGIRFGKVSELWD